MDEIALGQRVFGNWYVKRLLGRSKGSAVYELWRDELSVTYCCAMKVVSVCKEVGEDGYPLAGRKAVWEHFIMWRLKGCSHLVCYEDHAIVPHSDGGGWNFLIRMELLTPFSMSGGTLPFTCAQAVRLGIDICNGLEFCQRNGVLHRDVKLKNLFQTNCGNYKLGDFGLSKMASGDCRQRAGTPNYMAPEVDVGGEYTYSADVYSLGLCLYRVLSDGRLPFWRQDIPKPEEERAALRRRLDGAPLPRTRWGSERLWAAVAQACAYEPMERFATARGFRTALEACLPDEDDVHRLTGG